MEETSSFAYHPQMALNTVTGSNTYVQSSSYDVAGRLVQLVRGLGTLTTNYTYYGWTETASLDGQQVGQGARLKQVVTGSLQDLRYLYDAVGNVRKIEDYKLGNPQKQNFTYDATEFHLRCPGPADLPFQYDAENRMTAVSGSATASFVFDGDGNRVKSTIGGATTVHIGAYFEWTGSTSTMKKYYNAGGARIAMRTGASTLNFILTDHLGSTSVTTDGNGAQPTDNRYRAWGESRYASGTLPTKFTYTGQYSNVADFGLMYYGARWYDSALSRFAQADSIIPQPGNPLAWDRYAYALNNALRYVDPTGHETVRCNETCEKDKPRALSLAEMAALYGIGFIGNGWTLENMAAVLLGVDRVARAFSTALGGAKSASEAFKNVYRLTNGKRFEFGWGNCPECNGAGGFTYSSTLIRFQTLWINNPDNRIPNVIHELGHAFNNLFWTTLSTGKRVRLPEYVFDHAQSSIPGFPDRDSTTPNYGYGGPFGFWQQSREISASEEFADNFIGWTYNHWEETAAGEMRANWMNRFMTVAVDLASSR